MADKDFTERNRAHFDSTASSYEDRNAETFSRVREQIRSRREWFGIALEDEDKGDHNVAGGNPRKPLRLLDYACGPGTVSNALRPYLTQMLGIDLSEEMVKEYNDRARKEHLIPDVMFAAVGNLLDPNNPSPEEFRDEKWFNFDVAVVGFGFHHFEDPALAASRLAERLRPGGVLVIIDFLPHEGPGHGEHHSQGPSHGHVHHHHHHHPRALAEDKPTEAGHGDLKKIMATVSHFGFAEEDVKKTFQKAGVGNDFAFEVIAEGLKVEAHNLVGFRDAFMAKGKKAEP